MSASGNSANSSGRRNDFFGAAARLRGLVSPAARRFGGDELGLAILRTRRLRIRRPGSFDLRSVRKAERSRRCTLASPARALRLCGIAGTGFVHVSHCLLFFLLQVFPCNRRNACVRQICLQLLQCLQQALGVGLRHAGQRLSAGDLSELSELDQFRARGRRQMQTPGPPVGRMRMPLDQPLGLELVDDAAERDRLDLQQLGQTALVDAFVLREVSQDLPLRPRQARAARVLLEAPLQQAGDLVQQKSERWRIERWRA